MRASRRTVLGGLAATLVPLPSRAAPAAATNGPILLEAREGTLRLLPPPAEPTQVWGFNGQVPGPLIRVPRGTEVHVRLTNRLRQPTSLSWHGVRIANAMDGVAGLTQPPVMPGDSFDYRFKVPDAGFYWYHPHVHPFSAEQIGRGLYGLLVVDEPDPPPVDHDLIVVLDDWMLDAKGQIDGNFLDRAIAARAGRIGPLVTVNGPPAPETPMVVRPGARMRLRILNACGARIALVAMAGMNTTVIAVDGQASELFPPAAGTLPIGPGSRFELMADVPVATAEPPTLLLRGNQAPDTVLMSFPAKGAPLAPRKPVARLAENTLLPSRIALERSLKRDLVIGGGADAPPTLKPAPIKPARKEKARKAKPGAAPAAIEPSSSGAATWLWTIDGVGSDASTATPFFRVKRGDPVTLAFINRTAYVQQMHVHGHVFRVLHDLDDGWDPYWRESILVGPGKTKHVAFVADNPGKWAVESLILDRQVTGLAGWFEVR